MAEVPSIAKYIQQEEVDFRSPMSESLLQKMGGSLNYLLNFTEQFAIGEIVTAMVSEATFQSQMGTTWVLSDGRDVSGSKYADLTGNSSIPDCRGLFLRSQNGNRNPDFGNPLGNVSLGTLEHDSSVAHNHLATVNDTSLGEPPPPFGSRQNPTKWGGTDGLATAAQQTRGSTTVTPGPCSISGSVTGLGGNEMRPYAVTMNFFIKIN